MLVAAFEVNIRRIREVLVLPQNGPVTHAGLEPYIHDVRTLLQIRRAAFRTLHVAKQLADTPLEPNVDAFPRDALAKFQDQFAVQQRLAAAAPLPQRERDAPPALPGDHP